MPSRLQPWTSYLAGWSGQRLRPTTSFILARRSWVWDSACTCGSPTTCACFCRTECCSMNTKTSPGEKTRYFFFFYLVIFLRTLFVIPLCCVAAATTKCVTRAIREVTVEFSTAAEYSLLFQGCHTPVTSAQPHRPQSASVSVR